MNLMVWTKAWRTLRITISSGVDLLDTSIPAIPPMYIRMSSWFCSFHVLTTVHSCSFTLWTYTHTTALRLRWIWWHGPVDSSSVWRWSIGLKPFASQSSNFLHTGTGVWCRIPEAVEEKSGCHYSNETNIQNWLFCIASVLICSSYQPTRLAGFCILFRKRAKGTQPAAWAFSGRFGKCVDTHPGRQETSWDLGR